MSLIQVTRREGYIPRVPRGQEPVIEMDLEPHQHIITIKLWELSLYRSDERKTVDWKWEAYIQNDLSAPEPSLETRLYEIEARQRPLASVS